MHDICQYYQGQDPWSGLSRSITTFESGRALEKVQGDVKDICNALATKTIDLIKGFFLLPSVAMKQQVDTRKSNRHEKRWGHTFGSPGRQKAAGNNLDITIA
jgi:hypothetical protein